MNCHKNAQMTQNGIEIKEEHEFSIFSLCALCAFLWPYFLVRKNLQGSGVNPFGNGWGFRCE
jgi:hypothetical protein